MNKRYSGFTLVEMLIVMGILSVLMAIGVSVARFAVQRANNIQHQSAVDQLFQAMQSYYTDNREYPTVGETGDPTEFIGFGDALDVAGVLDPYVDANFDGGAAARFYYFTETGSSPQAFLACVSFSEPDAIATSDQGGYCNGNGFGDPDVTRGVEITTKELGADDFRTLVNDQELIGTSWDGATQTWL